MKIIGLVLFGLTFGSFSHAALVENGSSFTGNYKVQESTCEKRVFNYQTGQYDLVPDFIFEGTPEGLKEDGRLMAISALQMADHGGGIVTGSYAQYQSGLEFVMGFIQINPSLNQGRTTVTVEDYTINSARANEVVQTTTVTIGRDPSTTTRVCHFVRVN